MDSRILRRSLDHLAIDIELELMACAIADPHRARSEIAAQKIEFSLTRSEAAKYVVHNAQLRLGQPRGMQQPCQKALGLIQVAQTKHGAHGKRRIAQPAVAIIPVERIAN